MKSNISVGADDAHPGVQRQLTYETAPLLRELGKCHLNHRSARAMGKGNQTLTGIQDEWLLFPPYLELEEICNKNGSSRLEDKYNMLGLSQHNLHRAWNITF